MKTGSHKCEFEDDDLTDRVQELSFLLEGDNMIHTMDYNL